MKLKLRKSRKLRLAFDKKAIRLVATIIVFTILLILILSLIPVRTSFNIEITSSELLLSLDNKDSQQGYVQILSSAIIANKIRLKHFAPIIIEIEKFRKKGEVHWTNYEGLIKIIPDSNQGVINISSSNNDLSLIDLFSSTNSRIKISSTDNRLAISVFHNITKDSTLSQIIGILSVGQDIIVCLERCTILKENDQPLFEQKNINSETIYLAISEIMPNIEFKSTKDQINMLFDLNKGTIHDSLEILRGVKIKYVSFSKKSITPNEQVRFKSAIQSGFVYLPDENDRKIHVQKGETLQYRTKNIFMKVLNIKSSSLRTNFIINGTTSLKITNAGKKQEYVGSVFDWLLKRPEISICYAIVLAILSLLSLSGRIKQKDNVITKLRKYFGTNKIMLLSIIGVFLLQPVERLFGKNNFNEGLTTNKYKILNAIVRIEAGKNQGVGSGILIGTSNNRVGWILTSYQLVKDFDKVSVTFFLMPDTRHIGYVVKKYQIPKYDLALIGVRNLNPNHPVVTFGKGYKDINAEVFTTQNSQKKIWVVDKGILKGSTKWHWIINVQSSLTNYNGPVSDKFGRILGVNFQGVVDESRRVSYVLRSKYIIHVLEHWFKSSNLFNKWKVDDVKIPVAQQMRPSKDFTRVYKVARSVVKIVAGDNERIGSGVLIGILERDVGLVLTAYHVVQGFREVAVCFKQMPQKRYTGNLTKFIDPKVDLAVIIVRNLNPHQETITFGKNRGKEGEVVITIGHPLEQEWRIDDGIINKREGQYWVCDIPVLSGSSGCPLLDMDGQMLGIILELQDPKLKRAAEEQGATYAYQSELIIPTLESWFENITLAKKWNIEERKPFIAKIFTDWKYGLFTTGVFGGIGYGLYLLTGDDKPSQEFPLPPGRPMN